MIEIKKIITALGDNRLNHNLRENYSIEVIGNDIPYQDGVLDTLKGNSEIEILLLSESLIGEYDIKSFINQIFQVNKKLDIIFFLFLKN